MPDVHSGLRGRSALAAAVVAAVVAGLPAIAAAQAPTVDLEAFTGDIEGAVPGGPAYLAYGITNLGVTDATEVVLTLELPAGVEVVVPVGTPNNSSPCDVDPGPTGTTVVCATGNVPINHSFGYELYVEFAATGTYVLTASATADQDELDGTEASTTVVVVDEDADLYGSALFEPQVVSVGQQVFVSFGFGNHGPTAALDATVTGVFPAGSTVVPGTFWYGSRVNEAASACTVTATSFTCTGAWADPTALHQYVSYQLVPTEAGPLTPSVTVTGRNDPDHTNDTSTYSLEVATPAAELYPWINPVLGAWVAQQTRDVTVSFYNYGELAAEDVVVGLEAPPGWTVGLPTDPDPAGRSCSVAPGGGSVACTFDEVAANSAFVSFAVPVTSPAGPAASGTATLTVTTPTPEHGWIDNTFSLFLTHRLSAPVPTVVVDPDTDLHDGDGVDVQIIDFPENAQVAVVQCQDGVQPSIDTCDLGTLQFTAVDASGGFALRYGVSRIIVTNSGLFDCAVEACAIAVAGFGTDPPTASAPIAFAEEPDTGLRVAIGDDAFTSGDGRRDGTLTAVVECDEAMTVTVLFDYYQFSSSGAAPRRGSSSVTAPCTPGPPIEMTSDLMGGLDPVSGDVAIGAVSGTHRAVVTGTVVLDPFSTKLAELQARLADPDDTTVVAEFVSALMFRLAHNPVFALRFWQAVLQSV